MNENENTSPKCPRCGAPLPANAPEGLCPRCLVAANLSAETEMNTGELGPGGTVVIQPAPAPPPPPDEVAKLFPHLEILAALGRGGMGAVYKARQPRLDRFVALKILSADKKGDPQFAERFEREARTLGRLHHPNIVAIYDFGEVQGVFYLLMEFVDGLTLRQFLQTRKLSAEEALTIVPKICEALQYAHQQGVVHRDIKPENILLDKQGRVKIADFGIAKILGQAQQSGLTQEQQIIGTPHYMAPEQVEHPQTVDHRADIYSLGVVLYEMLTGELPLGKFAPPSRKVQVDVRLDEVVLHALEKEPERRYQQARQVQTDVETITSGHGKTVAGRAASSGYQRRPDESEKTILPAFLLAFFFGIFGAHRFYVGKIWSGLVQLGGVGAWIFMIVACATTGSRWQPALGIMLGVTIFACVIAATIDWILLACRAFTDGHGKRITQWTNPRPEDYAPYRTRESSAGSGVPPVFGAPPSSAPPSSAPPPAGPAAGNAFAANPTSPGMGKIIAPAVALMIAGVWKIFGAITGLMFIAGFQMNVPMLNSMQLPGFHFPQPWGALTTASIIVFRIIPGLLILFGGFQMLRLRSYAWSLAAAILSIIACSFISFPIGVWALIVLSLRETREMFAGAATGSTRPRRVWPWVTAALVIGFIAVVGVFAASSYFASAIGTRFSNDVVFPNTSEYVELADFDSTTGTPIAGDPAVTNSSDLSSVNRLARSGADPNFSKTFAVAPGGGLTMNVDRGEIRVTGSDENTVQVRVRRDVSHASQSEAQAIIEEHRVDLRQNGNAISIAAEAPHSLSRGSFFGFLFNPGLRVRYEIVVPHEYTVHLKTSGGNVRVSELRGPAKAETLGGELNFAAIEGDVDGSTMGGGIRAEDCRKTLALHTMGGEIVIKKFTGPSVRADTLGGNVDAEFAAAPSADCDLHTSGGNVTARVPESAAFTLDAHTFGGSVSSDLPVLTQGKHRGSSLKGTVNGGGPLLKLQTSGGNISVKRM